MLRIAGDGSVRKNGNHWQVVVSFRDEETGKRTQKTYPTEVPCTPSSNRGKGAALEVRSRIVSELRLAEMGRDAGATAGLIDSIAEFIEYRYKAGIISYQTYEGYRYSLKHIARGFEDSSIGEVSPASVTAWIADSLAAGTSANVMKKALKLLSQFYKSEISKGTGRAIRNPCDGVETPAPRDARPNPLTRANLEKLNRTVSAMEDCILRRSVMIALNTGARVGEVCAMTWNLIDFDRRTVPIYASVTKSEGGPAIKDTKGHERRHAPMTLALYCYLKDLYERQLSELASAGMRDPEQVMLDCYVISGTPRIPSPQLVSKKYTALSESLGLKGIDGTLTTFHGLRHTFATQWISSGGDVKALSDILGHKDATMTLNVYSGCDELSRRQGMALAAPQLTKGFECGVTEDRMREYYDGSTDLYPIRVPARIWARVANEAGRLGDTADEYVSKLLDEHLSSPPSRPTHPGTPTATASRP